jgi:hypothetical protein
MTTTINKLFEITKKSIVDTIGFYDWDEEEYQKEVFSYITKGRKDYGEVTATIVQKVVSSSFSGTWDEPPHGFEAEYYIEDAEVSIFNTKGDYLPNVSEKIKELLEKHSRCLR